MSDVELWAHTRSAMRTAEQTVVQRAGELALGIADLAAQHNRLSALTKDIADLLLAALDLEVAAFFWCRTPDHHSRHRMLLHNTALACRDRHTPEDIVRRVKLLAYRAVVQGGAVERKVRPGNSEALDALALPVGSPAPWAVLVVVFRPHAGDIADLQEVVLRIAGPLATSTRAAHVLDEAARSEHQHSPRRAIFTASSEAILTIGEDFTIQEANPAFARMTGWAESASVGRPCYEVIRCRDERKLLLCNTPQCPLHAAFAAEGGSITRDLSWQTHLGRLHDVSASFTAHRQGADLRSIVVARDVATLHAADRMRANFISMVSHELRTPLNSINGFLEIVLEGQVGSLNERQREFLGYAYLSTQQLTTLVEDILLISKADSGQFILRTAEMDPATVLTQAIQAVQPAADKAEVTIAAELPSAVPLVQADDLRIQQVLTNLLGNAIKFSPAGGAVTVAVAAADDEVRFSVADTGKGVSPEDQARIFERFYQSEAATRHHSGGYGLGLAIAKLIVEQHGGHIWVESQAGQGATFSFTIPLRREESGQDLSR